LGQVTTATISGTIKDPTDSAIPGAKIVIVNEGTGISRAVQADSTGHYAVLGLNLGTYRVTGSFEGFQTEVRSGIELTVGREVVVDFTLPLGSVAQVVNVQGGAPLVDTTSSSLGSLVDARSIRELPLNGRSYDQLALIQPGVVLADNATALSSTSYIYGTGKRFSVGGQRSTNNSFLLDGTNISDQANGTPGGAAGTNLGVDTILEFKIFTNSFKAEYGRDSGAIVSAITRSGTNNLNGTIFEYIRNSAVDARNYFDVGSSPPPFRRNQFGGVIGGPIKKDKLFFFAGYEALRQALATTLTATVPTVDAKHGILPTGTVPVNPASVPYLNLYPDPNGPDLGGGVAEYISSPTASTNEDNVMGRIDYQLNQKTGIFGRYMFDQDKLNAPLNIPPQALVLSSRRQYLTLQATSVLSERAVNNFRFAFNRSRNNGDSTGFTTLSMVPGQEFGSLSIAGTVQSSNNSTIISSIGNSKGQGASAWRYNVFEWADDFSYARKKNSIKAGVDVQRIEDNNQRSTALRGAIAFPTFQNLLTGTPSNFQAGYPLGVSPTFGIRQSLFALYGQDDYSLSSRLTLNVGMRWEITTDPYDANGNNAILPSISATNTVLSSTYFHILKKTFEPRFGLDYQLTASGKSALRLGAGIYHNQILPWLFPNQTAIYPFFGQLSLNNPPFPDPAQGLIGQNVVQSSVALNVMNPVQKVPTSYEYTMSIQQQIARDTVVQVAYAGSINRHEPLLREEDTYTPTVCSTSASNCPAGLADGTLYYAPGSPRRNPSWASIRWNSDDGPSSYNSGTITLRSQTASGFVGQIYYAYSKAMDEASNVGAADSLRSPAALMDPFDASRDWALSEFDVKHAVVANWTLPIPVKVQSPFLGVLTNGWTFNGISTFESGLPFTITLAASRSKDGSNVLADRPNLVPGFSNNPTHGSSAGCPGFLGAKVGTASHWYDPCAFSLQASGTYGNLGRNTVIGPGVVDTDLALEKGFKIHDNARATVRFETFNIFNHANFGLPNSGALTTTGTPSPTAGLITYTTTSSRQLQLALRLSF
jgi:hypothetical protein